MSLICATSLMRKIVEERVESRFIQPQLDVCFHFSCLHRVATATPTPAAASSSSSATQIGFLSEWIFAALFCSYFIKLPRLLYLVLLYYISSPQVHEQKIICLNVDKFANFSILYMQIAIKFAHRRAHE